MDEWHVGDPADWGDSVGVPDIPYMGYLNGEDDEDDDRWPRDEPDDKFSKAKALSDEAWRLENEGRFEEALVLINRAIEKFPFNPNHFNRKGIILNDLCRYDEAIEAYDRALAVSKDNNTLANKSYCMVDSLRMKHVTRRYTDSDLDYINKALKILPDGEDKYSHLHMKGNILDDLGNHLDAQICYLLASEMYDRVDEAERQIEMLESSSSTFINITATKNYQFFRPFNEGVVVDLVRETDNSHDRDAIRVEIDGETVGYVANSEHTLIRQVKSASDIRNTDFTRAKVLFILLGTYVIAELI